MATGNTIVLSVLVALSVVVRTTSQLLIPPRYDGFVYKNGASTDSVLVEAFFDPICPDSRDSWWPLKEVLGYYKNNITFIVHPFALPYHNNAFIACRSLHIANNMNRSYTFPLLERFFQYQQIFYNKPTFETSPATITQQIIHFALENTGNSSFNKFESGFQDSRSDMTTRISFKYGCSRGVTGTPYFFVNGIPLYNEETIDFIKWKSIIDPLLTNQAQVDSYKIVK